MLKRILIIAGIAVAVVALSFVAFRMYTKSFSPADTATYSSGDLTITVDYCQPSKKERVIFGELVPYSEVWRTGANEATEIELSQDVTFGGKPLKAGRYELFTIPEKDQWTIIINSALGQWGAFDYDQNLDVLRVEVPTESLAEVQEMFNINFSARPDGVDMNLTWDQTKVKVPIYYP